MKQFHSTLLLTACAGLLLVAPGLAETLSLEHAQELRQEADNAGAALKRIPKSSDPAVAKELGTAEGAVGRISEKLNQYISQNGGGTAAAGGDIYQGGKKYPPIAKARIDNFDVPVNATVVHVPVTLDKESANTVIAHVRVYDGEGGRATPDTTKAVIFYPGDPLTKTASFAVSGMTEGSNVKAVQRSVPDGGDRAGGGILITAREGAVNEPIEGGREAMTFEPIGQLVYSVTGETIQYDDEGGPDKFSTALAHGRTQVGNGETGYYGTVDLGGFERTPEGLVLSTRRLDQPMKVGTPAMYYPFLATMLSGHKTTAAQFKYGTVEWVAKMPNRFGSWPALWLVPTGGWPPEIDVYEGFGYNNSWKFNANLSTNLHGGDKQTRTFTRPAMSMEMKSFGLANTLDTEFHTFAVTVTPEWITMFVDTKETMRYANPFKGENWYPLTNVAVKAKDDSPYTEGSGAMTLQSLKVWRSE